MGFFREQSKEQRKNVISTMILSSATLPKLHELTDTIADFKNKFPDVDVDVLWLD